jgi:hypothetical protein
MNTLLKIASTLIVAGLPLLAFQAISGTAILPPLPSTAYINPSFPGQILGLFVVYGARLQRPGNERLTLVGTSTDRSGATAPATITTQIPGEIRVEIGGTKPLTLLYDGTHATANGVLASGADLDVLESLQDDTIENFFYSYRARAAVRFLGSRYRLDGKTTSGYQGSYADIYQVVQAVRVRATPNPQNKLFYFESARGTLLKARYRASTGVEVETQYSKWTRINGESVPQKIQRLENGKQVFSFDVARAVFSPGVQDGAFVRP